MKIYFRKNDIKKEYQCDTGQSVLQIAQSNNVPVYEACNGNGICGRCHVKILDQSKIAPKSELEEDTLDTVGNVSIQSRLACQVVVETDDLVVDLVD